MGILSFIAFAILAALGGLFFGADSRDDRRPRERMGAIEPLR